jgi:signal transduction histidine kinase
MSPHRKARLTFAFALSLLFISGIAAALTITRLIDSAQWVAHTYDVKLALADFSTAVSTMNRARTGYILSGNAAYVDEFGAARDRIPAVIQTVRHLTEDNSLQQRGCDRLQSAVDKRIGILNESMNLRARQVDDDAQNDYARQLATSSIGINQIVQTMQDTEQNLLDQRVKTSGHLFVGVILVLFVTFVLAIGLLWMHYRFLTAEAMEREKAEMKAKESDEASRRLSVRVMQLQDEERRKFSRELHDSLGQSLTVAKMLAESQTQQNPQDATLIQLVSLLDESLSETRTLSHLLHPPLLDELGLASAARWYVDGFTNRGGVPVVVEIDGDIPRLSRATELVFFRALQETLTNIHRHSKCTEARVSFRKAAGDVCLTVKDNGRGIPKETLERFQTSGTDAGIGLAGMRERVREQGGRFTIQSSAAGTTVTVILPVTSAVSAEDSSLHNDLLSL